jgi:chromosome segregation ATPase
VARRGYRADQVDDYLRYLDAQVLMLAADRDALLEERARLACRLEEETAEKERLRARLHWLTHTPQSAEGISQRVRVMLELAGEEIAELRERARNEVRTILAQAEIRRLRNERLGRRLEHDRAELAAELARVREMLARARRDIECTFTEAGRRAETVVARWAEALTTVSGRRPSEQGPVVPLPRQPDPSLPIGGQHDPPIGAEH